MRASWGHPWEKGPVPAEYAIIGLGPVQLTVPNPVQTVKVLTELMGFRYKDSMSRL